MAAWAADASGNGGTAVAPRAGSAALPRPGTLVWLLREGGFGRVVATAHGGLLCRVRPERGGPAVEHAGCELLPVAEDVGEGEEDGAGTG